MALFFDALWFDARLEERGLSRATLAAVSGLSADEVVLLFKDQREMSPREVAVVAELLGATPVEVAEHAGVSTRASAPASSLPASLEERLRALEARVAAMEAALKVR